MADEQREFWSQAAQRYDRVVALQIGPATRSLVRDRLVQEKRTDTARPSHIPIDYIRAVKA